MEPESSLLCSQEPVFVAIDTKKTIQMRVWTSIIKPWSGASISVPAKSLQWPGRRRNGQAFHRKAVKWRLRRHSLELVATDRKGRFGWAWHYKIWSGTSVVIPSNSLQRTGKDVSDGLGTGKTCSGASVVIPSNSLQRTGKDVSDGLGTGKTWSDVCVVIPSNSLQRTGKEVSDGLGTGKTTVGSSIGIPWNSLQLTRHDAEGPFHYFYIRKRETDCTQLQFWFLERVKARPLIELSRHVNWGDSCESVWGAIPVYKLRSSLEIGFTIIA
jgi:hypothetical protein